MSLSDFMTSNGIDSLNFTLENGEAVVEVGKSQECPGQTSLGLHFGIDLTPPDRDDAHSESEDTHQRKPFNHERPFDSGVAAYLLSLLGKSGNDFTEAFSDGVKRAGAYFLDEDGVSYQSSSDDAAEEPENDALVIADDVVWRKSHQVFVGRMIDGKNAYIRHLVDSAIRKDWNIVHFSFVSQYYAFDPLKVAFNNPKQYTHFGLNGAEEMDDEATESLSESLLLQEKMEQALLWLTLLGNADKKLLILIDDAKNFMRVANAETLKTLRTLIRLGEEQGVRIAIGTDMLGDKESINATFPKTFANFLTERSHKYVDRIEVVAIGDISNEESYQRLFPNSGFLQPEVHDATRAPFRKTGFVTVQNEEAYARKQFVSRSKLEQLNSYDND